MVTESVLQLAIGSFMSAGAIVLLISERAMNWVIDTVIEPANRNIERAVRAPERPATTPERQVWRWGIPAGTLAIGLAFIAFALLG
jgi:hypothetical protein